MASNTPVFKSVASTGEGIAEIIDFITNAPLYKNKRKQLLLVEKAYKIIQHKRMENVDRKKLTGRDCKGRKRPRI